MSYPNGRGGGRQAMIFLYMVASAAGIVAGASSAVIGGWGLLERKLWDAEPTPNLFYELPVVKTLPYEQIDYALLVGGIGVALASWAMLHGASSRANSVGRKMFRNRDLSQH